MGDIMDGESPISFDYSFAFGQSPGDNAFAASGAGADNGPLNQPSFVSEQGDGRQASNNANSQHGDSMGTIDSVFDRETPGKAKSSQITSHPRGGSVTSLSGAPRGQEEGKDDDDTAPTWSELKTKAGKERKRLPLACIACRRKKIKCSGEKPACKHCLKARVPCVYKVTTRKAAPRTDYMAMLDKRLKRMEDRVIKIIPKEDLPDLSATGRSSVRPPLPGSNSGSKDTVTPITKRSAEEAFDAEIQNWTQKNRPNQTVQTSTLPKPARKSDNQLFGEGAESLPPQHIQEHLAEVFFDCVYGQSYLLLHKPSFMRKLKAGNVPPVLILAVCAVSARFSTHPQVSTETGFLRGEQWATPARNIVEKRHFEPNITILTTMIILGLHYFGTCEGGLSWSFGGQAMRMGYALQLHKELDHDPLGQTQAEQTAASGKATPKIPELSFTDREIRRRTMWACYLMDTFNSSGTERPSFLNEDYFSIQLPIKESYFQMEVPGHTETLDGHVPLSESYATSEDAQNEAKANMGVSAYIIKAVVVWKRIVKYLNLGGKEKDSHPIWDSLSQFASLQRQSAQLKASLPSTLTYNKDNLTTHASERLANQFITLHIILAQTTLFLHRFAIPTAPNSHRRYPPGTPKSFLATAATTVLDAAAQISKLLADSTGHSLTVPFAGYCAYASATVHIWGIFSKNPMLEKTSRENLRHNYKYLNRMKRYWGMFHYMAESVKDTYRAFADAAERSAAKSKEKPTTDAATLLPVDPVESAMISTQPSRAGSPRDMDGGEGKRADNKAGTSSETDKSKIFQYGDWFDKYPHGVSVAEWESKHLPHRGEAQKSTEAVMSQQSELQSVEEFFASLSPPSKADEHCAGGPNSRSRKVARKRGKSVVEEKGGFNAGPDAQTKPGLGRKYSHEVAAQQRHSHSSAVQRQLNLSTSELDVPMTGVAAGLQSGHGNSAFDLTSPPGMFAAAAAPPGQFASNPQLQRAQQYGSSNSPFEYTSPSTASNPGGSSSGGQFNFNYTSALPHLDRQMVFGGYAGIDPATNGSTNALNNMDFWSNTWEPGIDVDGFSSFNDPFGIEMSGMQTGDAAALGSGMAGQQRPGLNSAWFMPFNIEPPTSTNFAGLDDFTGFDAMDVNSNASVSGGVFPAGLSPGVISVGGLSGDDAGSGRQRTGNEGPPRSSSLSQQPQPPQPGFSLY